MHSARTSPFSRPVWGCPPFAHRAFWIERDRHRGQSVDNPAAGVAAVRPTGQLRRKPAAECGRTRRTDGRTSPLSIRAVGSGEGLADRTVQSPYDVGPAGPDRERAMFDSGTVRTASLSNRAMFRRPSRWSASGLNRVSPRRPPPRRLGGRVRRRLGPCRVPSLRPVRRFLHEQHQHHAEAEQDEHRGEAAATKPCKTNSVVTRRRLRRQMGMSKYST